MQCKVAKNDLKKVVSGGEVALDSLIRINHPQELEWEKTSDPFYLTYTFTISFVSQEEYSQKVEALLGRKPSILFLCSNSPFAQGMRLQEDFTSEDLMKWLQKTAVKQNLILSENTEIWKENTTQVQYGGETIQTEAMISIDRMNCVPINQISILTVLKKDGSFERTVDFSIPQSTLDQNGQSITAYMDKRVPEKGVGAWAEDASGKTYTVLFNAKNAQELNNKTNIVFDSNQNNASLRTESDALSNTQEIFEEQINLGAFISTETGGKVYTEYTFSSEQTVEIARAELLSGEVVIDADEYLYSNRFSYASDCDVLHVKLTSKEEFPLEAVSIGMMSKEDGSFQRIVSLRFDGSQANKGAAKAKEYFIKKEAEYTTVEQKDNICTVSIIGSAEELNLALSKLFGEGNSVKLTSYYDFQPVNTTEVTDQIDLRQFLGDVEYRDKPVGYLYTSSDKIKQFLQQDNGQETQSADLSGQTTVSRQLPSSGVSKITVSSSRMNVLFLVVIGTAILVTLIVVTIVVWYLIKALKKHTVKIKGPDGVVVLEELDEACFACGAPIYKGTYYCTKCGIPVGTVLDCPPILEEEKREKEEQEQW